MAAPASTTRGLQPSGGLITLSNVQTAFGGQNPISLSEYYGAAGDVPASAAISLSQFYGKAQGAPGLAVKVVTGYFNDNVDYFSTTAALQLEYRGVSANVSSITAATNGHIPVGDSRQNYSVEWTGYFYANVAGTGTYTFTTSSDDASYLWVGPDAVTGFTTVNATVNNGGPHADRTISGSVTLTGPRYYDLRVQFGEATGGDSMVVSVAGPTFAATTTLDRLLFVPDVPAANLVGWYDGASWTGTQWSDKSGKGNHALTVQGTVGASTLQNGWTVLTGGTSASITFPTAILPATYTLFHVARYNGATRRRIFTGTDRNWLSGFHADKTGVAYHEGYVTQLTATTFPLTDWLVSADQNNLYRGQGVTLGSAGGGSTGQPSFARLSINTYGSETTDWAVAEVIVYDRALDLADIQRVEGYLFAKYAPNVSSSGLVGWYDGASWTGGSQPQWRDKSGSNNHAVTIKGTVGTARLNGRVVLTGGTGDGILFPAAILPATYTLFHVARYTSTDVTKRKRIFDGATSSVNWLSGFENNKAGVANHNGYLTQNTASTFPQTAWLVSTDQNNLYRGQGAALGSSGAGTPSFSQLSINYGISTTEYSDWAVAEVIVFNRTLSLDEIQQVERYLFGKYGLATYPYPSAPMTGATLSINDVGAPVAAYTVSVSSTFGGLAAFSAFDRNAGSLWASASLYNVANGSGIVVDYNGTVTTTASGTAYAGEWLQVQLPFQKSLVSFVYTRQYTGSSANTPKDWAMLGSNDGTTWTLLMTQTNFVWSTETGSAQTVMLPTPSTPFSYFRWVCMKVATNTNFSVAELLLYGR